MRFRHVLLGIAFVTGMFVGLLYATTTRLSDEDWIQLRWFDFALGTIPIFGERFETASLIVVSLFASLLGLVALLTALGCFRIGDAFRRRGAAPPQALSRDSTPRV